MFKWLLGGETDSKIPKILGRDNVGYLSASCCHPAAAASDEQLLRNVKEAMAELGVEREIHVETLTGAQAGMRSILGHLDLRQSGVVTKVMSLFSTKGLSAFPILFVNGEIAFYGGIPTKAEIVEHMRTRLTPGAKDKAETVAAGKVETKA
jgi:hypothetical protein